MNNNKENIFAIIGVVIVVALVYFYFSSSKLPNTEVVSEENIENIETIDNEVINNIPKEKITTVPVAPTGERLPTITEDGTYLIYYFDGGFSPNTLQIRRGSSVRFINKTDISMRIYASNQDLSMYREFNQTKSVGEGGTYDYLFGLTGVWPFTNYNNQAHQGNILVY